MVSRIVRELLARLCLSTHCAPQLQDAAWGAVDASRERRCLAVSGVEKLSFVVVQLLVGVPCSERVDATVAAFDPVDLSA